jgi:hypothetical protein
MNYPDENFRLDFTRVNWDDYRPDKITVFEAISAYNDSGKEWNVIKDPQNGELYYFIIGFSSSARFLFILLKEHEDDFNVLIVLRILVAKHEPQIRKFYYEPKFQAP